MQIQISWLLQKPTDLDLHCLQRQVYPGSAGQGLRVKNINSENSIQQNGLLTAFSIGRVYRIIYRLSKTDSVVFVSSCVPCLQWIPLFRTFGNWPGIEHSLDNVQRYINIYKKVIE